MTQKWNIWRLLGRPKYQHHPVPTRWKKLAKYFRINQWRNGILTKLEEPENRWDILRSYDLSTILLYIEFNILIPLISISLLLLTSYEILTLLLIIGIILSLNDMNLGRSIGLSWNKGRKIKNSKIFFNRGNLLQVDLSNIKLSKLYNALFTFSK